MAAGLPIVASDIDAHKNLLAETEGAYLIATGKDLEQALGKLAEQDAHRKAVQAVRSFIREEQGTWDDCARRYLNLYKELLHAV